MADVNISTAEVINLAEYMDSSELTSLTGVDADKSTSVSVTSAGLFSQAVLPMLRKDDSGFLNISISGTFVGTIALQRSFDKGVTWHNYATYTAVTEAFLTDKEPGVWYRIGSPTTFTSGTAVCRLGIGR